MKCAWGFRVKSPGKTLLQFLIILNLLFTGVYILRLYIGDSWRYLDNFSAGRFI